MSWQSVGRADQVPAGAVHAAIVGGRLCAMEARCPHQWSDLGSEGVVEGDEIVCGAHCWRFDTSGRGTKFSVKGRRDEKADIEVFDVRDHEGRIEVDLGEASG